MEELALTWAALATASALGLAGGWWRERRAGRRRALALQQQEELLAAVSHELRTPLHRLRFAVELVGLADQADDRRKKLEQLEQDLLEMEALVEELLTWSRLGAAPDRLLPGKVAVGPLLERLISEARRSGVVVERVVEPNLTLWGEERLVRRAVQNGLVNAVRYGQGRVALTARRGSGGVEILLEDDGPGIPEADRERVFQPFVRLEAARSKAGGGVGLGLALVDRILRAHRGEASFAVSRWGGASLRMYWPDKR